MRRKAPQTMLTSRSTRAPRRAGGLTARWRSLPAGKRRILVWMALVVLALHVVGFAALIWLVTPRGGAGALTAGVGLTAYALGLRHAFDADHISAIDNTTRALMEQEDHPVSVGFWFSLGHSTVVFALALLIALGVRTLNGPVRNEHSELHTLTNLVGTGISGLFLYLIAALNALILINILGVLRDLRAGRFDERELERQLSQRGLMNRFFGRLTGRIRRPAQIYPIGLLFGLGFDTASEVALLVLAGSAGAGAMPWYAILCLPVLFAAGMALMDTLDGAFMGHAYQWALARPTRRLFYNLTMTGLSVTVALVVGTIEVLGLVASQLHLAGAPWHWIEGIDINALGIVIVVLFAATWLVALLVWRFGRLEQRLTPTQPPEPESLSLSHLG